MLARYGSYAAAAAQTGISEASLHRAVTGLGMATKQTLVERRRRGVTLTRSGRALARRFQLAEAELRSALAELSMIQGREVDRIVIGAMPLSRARLLPHAIATFQRAHPQVHLSIIEGSHSELVGPLRNGDLDLLLGALRDLADDDELVQQPLFYDRPVVLGRAEHPILSSRTTRTLEQLASYEWVLPPEGTPLRAQWRQMFLAGGIVPPRVAIECGSVMLLRELLVHGDFLTLLSEDQVAVELDTGWLVKIDRAPGSRLIGVTSRRDWRPTRLQQRFMELLGVAAQRITRVEH
jgi:DNA-binding transcriptional LysR family regulator